ncbi:MAG: RNA pseudouridine synthase, partial [Pseudomonadota bacterium]|nr:RNA pseudouridine synthase [Pseudomonadota bacterium]
IVGDKLYNKNGILGKTPARLKQTLQNFSHQALHAFSLEFKHPESNKPCFFSCPYPQDFTELLQILASEDNKWEQK